jgi:glycosyltransferase involved in cell wall biosynthesis
VTFGIDLVLPCLDEAGALPWVLGRIPAGVRAIVVDNGSSDGSAGIAADAGATVVTCIPRGYGAACDAGLSAATAELVAFCDCDGTLDPAQLVALAAAIDGGADLAFGRRRPISRRAWSFSSRMANKELARRVRRRTGTRIHDVSPMRMARSQALRALDIRDRRFGYPVETVVRAAAAGWRFTEVDVDYRERVGQSKVTGTLRGYLQAVRDSSAVLKS